jgi:outer membrane protein assembly factor BamB
VVLLGQCSDDDEAFGLDGDTGDIQWRKSVDPSARAIPIDGGRVALVHWAGGTTVLDVDDGRVVRTIDARPQDRGQLLLADADGDVLFFVELPSDFQRVYELSAWDAVTGRRLWAETQDPTVETLRRPDAADGRLYVIAGRRTRDTRRFTLRVLDEVTGRTLHALPLEQFFDPASPGGGSPELYATTYPTSGVVVVTALDYPMGPAGRSVVLADS